MKKKNKFNKFPFVQINGFDSHIYSGWENIFSKINNSIDRIEKLHKVIAFEFYQGVHEKEIISEIKLRFSDADLFDAKSIYKSNNEIEEMVYPELTDDRVFGKITNFNLVDFFDSDKIEEVNKKIRNPRNTKTIIYGNGASFFENIDLIIYFDLARWEIIQRFRKNEVSNLFIENSQSSFEGKYKRAFFIDWRICDKHKTKLYDKIDFVVDTNNIDHPKMITGSAFRGALEQAVNQPFELVPFFDPGPWGGQWMKEVCDLDKDIKNFAWCFNCVPEENSILFKFGNAVFESPSINLVLYRPKELLGENVYNNFGAEFPIRFDFLDTFDGGNLSLQVHPTTQYIKENFRMSYTQDESYYILDCKPGAKVFLGLKEHIDKDLMIDKLLDANQGNSSFPAEEFVEQWEIKKHDHFLIPAGTVHCSGKNSLVLEISATPYIFTFKLWDWDRLGLDGKPRPIHINHGKKVIQWDRTTNWTKENLVNKISKVSENNTHVEEKTGLHELEFIETRRHWFTEKIIHQTNGTVNVLNLVEGNQVLVESPNNKFEPFIVNYAETFVIPANIDQYTIKPFGNSINKKCGTIKAYVREN
ncbi:MAG: class I mannose-6-phosphate isomerase [Ignavibacteriales bacterium]|nr:class I mannose-6-phosphate isomerase [Ignavibacteriales bacterium]MCB9218121.1 class I mannose-6-phosphate isomerase [Ignavibacteriales bacterium]MCB9260510.1 class I mannose-6-phosphate isomerase [Ignavibacteriales bacterium]